MANPKPARAGLRLQATGQDSQPAASPLNAAAPSDQSQRREALFTATDLVVAGALATLVGATYVPVIEGLLGHMADYRAHASFAKLFVDTGTLLSPACLLHLLVAGLVTAGLSSSYESATFGMVIAGHAATVAALYLCARWALGGRAGFAGRGLPAIIALLGPFVQPPVSRLATYSIGYIWAEPYHSPTYALLKPCALAAAAFAVCFLGESRRPAGKVLFLCAALVAAGTLAKPSYAICALPALVLYSLYLYARHKPFSRTGVFWGWLLPAFAVLGWQYLRTYTSLEDQSRYADSIIFAPLAVMKTHTNDLLAPYLWSVLLPLCVLAIYGKRAWADVGLRFSLIAFVFGTAYAYTLAEQYRLAAGNFLWSSYITMFVVYFFSIVFVLNQLTQEPRVAKAWAHAAPCLAVVVWQLTSGISVHLNYMRLYE